MSSVRAESSLCGVFIEKRARLRRIASGIIDQPELVDDIMQDAYLRVQGWPSEREIDKPYGYCCQVVRNLALDCYRRRRAEALCHLDIDDDSVEEIEGGVPPEDCIDQRKLLDALSKTLCQLPARTRMAYELNFLQGITQRQIGERLGVSATTVNFLIKDAMHALSACRLLMA